ncbi:hypothetical protein [Glaciimonas immobilis]|uniref:Uncharacterized protein YerC n=1 Tax=Glaciimonas immobilis TaxID=728004 RepID=A0A840RQ28_9BURK|nr:hypothetical protein [Glaciimonas immobilis]KAF3999350.1 hypothetical protein HAV38_05320 [Glaciimonas immobilis]MBB5198834.1 uncharacterized protein YerC [Glaciimonas immobilis]
MIQQINSAISQSQKTAASNGDGVIKMDERVQRSAPEGEELEKLYQTFKDLLEVNPYPSTNDIINCLQGYTNEKGKTPYAAIPTHTGAIAAVMEKLEGEIGKDGPTYARFYESLRYAVVSNGLLNSFMAKMWTPREEPEPW